jgi:hypothetical protein
MAGKGPDPYKCKDCDVLKESLLRSELAVYEKLQKVDANPTRCSSMAHNVMLNIMSNNVKGIKHQLDTLASCHNCELNYKITKLVTKMAEIGEEEGLNYYRSWIDEDIWGLLSFKQKVKVYHSVHGHWMYPLLATGIGVPPLVFRGIKGWWAARKVPPPAPKPPA